MQRRRPGRSGIHATFLVAAAAFVHQPGSVHGQEPIPPPDSTIARDTVVSVVRLPAQDTAAQDTTARDTVQQPRPGAAFLRSVILPGWGQSMYGAYFRGGVYYGGWAGSWFMNIKNAARLEEARELRGKRRLQVLDSLEVAAQTDSLLAVILADPTRAAELGEIIAQDSIMDEMRKLVNSRKQQRQDWITLTIFWTLAAGVDAFVTAHLSDFPATIGLEPEPGGATLRLEVPFPRRRP